MNTDDPLRGFAAALFGRTDDTEPEEQAELDPTQGNHVPGEGRNVTPPAPTDMHTFVRDLFDRPNL